METENSRLARDRLAKLTDKPIVMTTVQHLAQTEVVKSLENNLGVCKETADCITVALHPDRPETHENTFVHELLHKMLKHEGFPEIRIDEVYADTNIPAPLWPSLGNLRSRFGSVLQHPEVYRRMRQDYNLDMEHYFESLLKQKVSRFSKKRGGNGQELIFCNQQDILDGLEYFYYDPDQRKQVQSCFRDSSESAYNSCLQLHAEIEKTGTHTAHSCLRSGKVIRAHIIKFGEKRNLNVLNNMWKALDIKLGERN